METAEEFPLCEKPLAVAARRPMVGRLFVDASLFQTFPRERPPGEEVGEQRAGAWRVRGYESCPAGPPSGELTPLAGRTGSPREGEETPAEINKVEPHPEAVMAVPCLGEAMHVMLAKLANGGLRCATCGLPPFKLDHDTSSSKRRKSPQEEKAGQVKRVKLGSNKDIATVALSPEGAVLNSANSELLPGHASPAGVRCSRTCLTFTDALFRFGSHNFTSSAARGEQGGVPAGSQERRLSAARAATHQHWQPYVAQMRQEPAAANEPGSERHLAAFWGVALCEEPDEDVGEEVEGMMEAPHVGTGLALPQVIELRESEEVRSFPSPAIASRTQWWLWCKRSLQTSGTASSTVGKLSFKAVTNDILRKYFVDDQAELQEGVHREGREEEHWVVRPPVPGRRNHESAQGAVTSVRRRV